MHLVGFIVRIYHDASSPERQTTWLSSNIFIIPYIIIIIILVTTFVHDIYSYIPATNHVSRV